MIHSIKLLCYTLAALRRQCAWIATSKFKSEIDKTRREQRKCDERSVLFNQASTLSSLEVSEYLLVDKHILRAEVSDFLFFRS